MREILFRGKSENDGQWVEGSLVITTIEPAFDAPVKCYCIEDMTIGVFPNEFQSGLSETVDPETVGQYTGLTDKNGKKIFEGDIVAQSWYDHDEPSDDSFGEVVFCEYDCSFSVMDVQKDGIVPLGRCHAYHWEAEVIGNIHDNPELLEVSEDG